ncbi:MAG: VIT1/CCC1 transporter family protein [Methanomassiliicoccales archaeon]|nr:VIT1/CCC1 transporter family protein [Methanomassiliicoccales archaeon]
MKHRRFIEKLRTYSRATKLDGILRRYFIIGAFDGALTILGVILGAVSTGHLSREIILSAGIGGSIALAISSIVGAYEAERVESRVVQLNIEKAMLSEISGTEFDRALRVSAIVSAIIHGIAPLLAALVPIVPFAFFDVRTAALVSTTITLTFLFLMGFYFGKLAKERMILSGLRFVLVGIITALIIVVFFGAH